MASCTQQSGPHPPQPAVTATEQQSTAGDRGATANAGSGINVSGSLFFYVMA